MRNSLRAPDGIRKVEVDLDEQIAVVIYESELVQTSSMIKATTDIGFPSALRPYDE